jgi:hypothetical protein
MALILILTSVGVNEFISAGAAIAGVGLYYFIIWLLRDKLNNEFVFYIKNQQ